jgi:spore coat protein U-like protein
MYSATPRVMKNSAYGLPFNLSLNSGATSDDLSANSPGTQFDIIRDGQPRQLTLYARILAQNFRSLPGGVYSTSITLTLEY